LQLSPKVRRRPRSWRCGLWSRFESVLERVGNAGNWHWAPEAP
jgi:hypothetical protein